MLTPPPNYNFFSSHPRHSSVSCSDQKNTTQWRRLRLRYKWRPARTTAATIRPWWTRTAVVARPSVAEAVLQPSTAARPARSANKVRTGWKACIRWWTRTTRRCHGAGTPKTSSPISGFRRTTYAFTTKVYHVCDTMVTIILSYRFGVSPAPLEETVSQFNNQ